METYISKQISTYKENTHTVWQESNEIIKNIRYFF